MPVITHFGDILLDDTIVATGTVKKVGDYMINDEGHISFYGWSIRPGPNTYTWKDIKALVRSKRINELFKCLDLTDPEEIAIFWRDMIKAGYDES